MGRTRLERVRPIEWIRLLIQRAFLVAALLERLQQLLKAEAADFLVVRERAGDQRYRYGTSKNGAPNFSSLFVIANFLTLGEN